MSLALLLLPQLVAIRRAGYEVIGMSAPGPFVPQLEDAGIRHVPLRNSTRAADLRADAATAVETYRALRSLRPDILHTHNPKPGVYGRIAGRFARVPVVVNTVHGLYAQSQDRWLRRLPVYALERLAAAFSNGELVQNFEDVLTLRSLRIPEEKIHLLGNGVDLERFSPDRFDEQHRQCVRRELGVQDGEVLVGVVGRLVVEKGYREVFDAARRLRDTAPSARLVVVGPHEPDKGDAVSGDELASAEAAGVIFLGMRDDVERLYPAMDVYVLASHREGVPRSAMEAAAMGLPVIATDIRGCRQVVNPGRTGLLVPVRDGEALAAAIETLVADAGSRERMGRAGATKAAAEFDDRRQIEITLDLYARLLRERGVRGPA